MKSVPLRVLGPAVAVVAIAAAVPLAQRATVSGAGGPSTPPASASAPAAAPAPAPPVAEAPQSAASAVPIATAPAPAAPAPCEPEPAIEVHAPEISSTAELQRLLRERPAELGSASLGSPTRGSLFGGVELKDSDGIQRAGGYGWGTEMVIRSIERAVRQVRRCHPGSPPLYVGDISRERGGWLKPHRSHQSGLDADIGYYYRTQASWYQHATSENLDAARTWALVRALVEGGNVEMIFMDVSVQRLVKAHIDALPPGEQPPEDPFASATNKDALIRHAWGHATHFHVRFRDPAAVALGKRLADILPRFRGVRRAPQRAVPVAPKAAVKAPRPKAPVKAPRPKR
ncbi:penicillin-insensitive murein endopeptidase [Polyangium aurulentum]|uniref:penicillin-insensitive murein endopeptidase n=1 Tax=Polyangium aurulentum TaxID=2567896 RepID=UPI0010AEC58F|nr:penicillin-insensitive murein endopeptidase [Polyangium aurulentum]UQA61794.1 penicillin-insensitive murein endopeptidase [Polyangium aurulentum]